MKIYILDEILECENKKSVINNIFNEINKRVSNFNLIFSHLSVDGQEIYDDFYDYFLDNIKDIQKVEVITKTVKEMCHETLLSTLDYINKVIPEIEKLSNEFYKTPSKDTWLKLTDLLEGINWIINSFAFIDSNSELENIFEQYEKWNVYAKDVYSLKELIVEFDEILENNDLVSTGDILSYEIIPLFNSMKQKLEELIYKEVTFNVTSK